MVLFTWDPDAEGFWLVDDYFPEITEIDRRSCPTLDQLREVLGAIAVFRVPIPHDCTDGFCGAYWRRPEVYLDAGARSAISIFSKLTNVPARLERLRDDLASGAWRRRHAALLSRDEVDLGYRLVVASA